MACPFGDDHPGWTIAVEALYSEGRTYGALDYGDEVYGDRLGRPGGYQWHDVTPAAFDVTITVGAASPTSPIPVSELTLEVHDDEGEFTDFAPPDAYNMLGVYTPIRVRLQGAGDNKTVFAGRVESIADTHDQPPRIVTITAYGNVSTLVVSRAGWQRPAESASARVAALMAADPSIVYTTPGVAGANLLADAAASTITVRDELDRTAASTGWVMAESPDGTVQFLEWPVAAAGTRVDVTDCLEADNAAKLLASAIEFVADTASVLNRAEMTNTAGTVARTTDPIAIARWGERSQTFGFPGTGLAFANVADAQAVTDRAVTRWANIINHSDAVTADTYVDTRWLAVYARLSLRTPLGIDRRHPRPYALETIVVGWAARLTRNRAQVSIYTTTVTPTEV